MPTFVMTAMADDMARPNVQAKRFGLADTQ